MNLLYIGILILIIIFIIIGLIGHNITESNKWYKIFKLKGRDDE